MERPLSEHGDKPQSEQPANPPTDRVIFQQNNTHLLFNDISNLLKREHSNVIAFGRSKTAVFIQGLDEVRHRVQEHRRLDVGRLIEPQEFR